MNIHEYSKILELIGKVAQQESRKKAKLDFLFDAEFRVYSQWGEDGIIEWLVSNLTSIPKKFIEIGVENYTEANTRFLLINRNWRGLLVEQNKVHVEMIKKSDLYWRHDVAVINSFVNVDNINDIFVSSRYDGDVGILSIDIDGNDYWLWEAIDTINPWIVVCEYNAVFGDIYPLVVPYDETFNRTSAHYSNLYFGTSIQALISLGVKKGYSFVGTNRAGNNAFFVRDDVSHYVLSKMRNISAMPSLFRESRNLDGELTYVAGLQRSEIIKELPFVDVVSGVEGKLSEFGEIYSDRWRKTMS